MPAASLIRPMIESPPALSPLRDTRTVASYFSTSCTNFAEARACSPFSLTICMTRVTAPDAAAGRSDSLISRRARGAHLGELDQHRQVDAREYLDVRPVHDRDREIGRRAAEHVGEDHNAVARVG